MNSKLTLTIDETVIAKAKQYAKQKGRSLSDLVENYLKLTTSEEKEEFEISPVVKSLLGSFSPPTEGDYKELLTDILSEKYLKE